jgi:hypothetical protein
MKNNLSLVQWLIILAAFFALLSCTPGKNDPPIRPAADCCATPTLIYVSPSGDKLYQTFGAGGYSITFIESQNGLIKSLAQH